MTNESKSALTKEIRELVWTQFADKEPTEEELGAFVKMQLMFFLDMIKRYPEIAESLDRDEVCREIVESYWKDQSVRQELGLFLSDTDGNSEWLKDVEEEVDWYYWGQYEKHLRQQKHWAKDVVDTLGKDTREILALTADPNSGEGFKKTGLVVGSVQSGKTANYLGLICRAADVGYRYIVVLAATTNTLRSQTQQRIEEGFVGVDFRAMPDGTIQRVPVGVGSLVRDKVRRPNLGTTRMDDFKKVKMKTLLQINTDLQTEPWVFIIKKNATTLNNLVSWLKQQGLTADDQLFLVDDEADSASINTKYGSDEISRINSQIRELRALFHKSVYVGYTATPYANILIDKDQEDEKVGTDLFPRNFIFTLSPADSYFGPDKIFGDIEPDDDQVVDVPRYVRFIDDAALLPVGKKRFEVTKLPESMMDAIRTFLLSAAIKVIRDGKNGNVSMLINVSPYNPIQEKYQVRVDEYLNDVLKPQIKTYSSLPAPTALENSSELRLIKERWDFEFEDSCGISWDEVQPTLFEISKTLHTALINSKSKDALDYASDAEHVIAIGGYSLSRGLTLEGLVTSYFARNSRAYDTLMQMGRWFGHRPGYEDVCRIWMTRESAGWCKFVADATNDLIRDLVKMQRQGATPLQYGHKIKAHPSTLMVTARNKMGAGRLIRGISLSGRFIETTVLKRDQASLESNHEAARKLQSELESGRYECDASTKWGVLFGSVPDSLVRAFIASFKNDVNSMYTQSDQVNDYIGYYNLEGVKEWDVLFAGLSPDGSRVDSKMSFECAGRTLYRQRRSPGTRSDSKQVHVGNHFRISTRGIEVAGLSPAEAVLAEQEYEADKATGGRTPGVDRYYRERRTRPLLIIHYLDMGFKEGKIGKNGKTEYESALAAADCDGLSVENWPREDLRIPATGWSISFPSLKRDRNVEYVFNEVALAEMTFGNDEADEETGEDDE